MANAHDRSSAFICTEDERGVKTIPHCRLYANGLPYMPSTDWSLAGPLLEKYAGHLGPHSFKNCKPDTWIAVIEQHEAVGYGETPQIAICKAVVALAKVNHGKEPTQEARS